MTVTIRGTRQHDKHRMHISLWFQPNRLEWFFLFQRPHHRDYVGKGTKWFQMKLGRTVPVEYKPVKSKRLIELLKSIHP